MRARSEPAPVYTSGAAPASVKRAKIWRVETRRTRESVTVPSSTVRGPADAAGAFKLILGEDRLTESLCVMYLDTRNRMIGYEIAATGATNAVHVSPREVFCGALAACAVAIILAHNHPSGDPTPSADDIDLTRRMVAAGETVGIAVLDHIVIAGGEHRSIMEGLR